LCTNTETSEQQGPDS